MISRRRELAKAVASLLWHLAVMVALLVCLIVFLVSRDLYWLIAGLSLAVTHDLAEKLVRRRRVRPPVWGDVIETPDGYFRVFRLNENAVGFMYVEAEPLAGWLTSSVLVDRDVTVGQALIHAGWQPPSGETIRHFKLKGGSRWTRFASR